VKYRVLLIFSFIFCIHFFWEVDLQFDFTLPRNRQKIGSSLSEQWGDTEIAYLYLNQTGTFQWVCLTPCGFGPSGMGGAMTAPGSMEGQITVY